MSKLVSIIVKTSGVAVDLATKLAAVKLVAPARHGVIMPMRNRVQSRCR